MSDSFSRRKFLLGAALGGSAVWVGAGVPWPRALAAAERAAAERAAEEEAIERSVLTGADASTFEAIAARILPSGDGAGAREAGCARFADRALAKAEQESAELVRAGLAGVRSAAQERYGRRFAEISAVEQDEMLSLLESGEITGWSGGVDPRRFFATVRRLVILGFLSDPEHGGNRGAAGWQTVGYPAPRHDEGHTEAQLHGRQRVPPFWERRRRLPPEP